MAGEKASGRLIKPDGTEEFWWEGVNYHNVIPEEYIDACLASEKMKNKKVEVKRDERK